VELTRSKVGRPAVKEVPALASTVADCSALDAPAPSSEQVRTQVIKILQNSPLSRSARTRRLLQYIIEQALAGNSKRLKQYAIATEVLGRGTDFDPDTDPVVRLEAGKLRRLLEDYYLRAGSNDLVRISIPKGGYVPTFELIDRETHVAGGAAPLESAQANAGSLATAPGVQRVLVMPPHFQPKTEASQALMEGLFEQLTVELARYRDISVTTPINATKPGEASIDPVGTGIKNQARYVVSGSARQNGEQIRITVRLHDVRAGSIIWIECFDLNASSGLNLQAEDTIARNIAGAIADYYGVIAHTLSLQSVHSVARSWNAQDAIQRHRYLARTLTERIYRLARADLQVGIVQAAYHPMIWAALAHTIFYGNVLGFDEDENWMALVHRYARRSFELDHKCAFGHVVMALHALYQREIDDVLETCKRIMHDNPHAPSTKLSAGFFRALAGDWDNGAEMLNSALSVLLHPPAWAYRVTFLCDYRKKHYAEALHEISKYNAAENFTPPLLRAAALAQLGRREEAAASVVEVLRICPRFHNIAPRYFRYLTAFDDISDHIMEGLHQAGLRL